jgi:precorrin-3B synthase
MSATYSGTTRTRSDRCPGVLRPWPADDGGLVRIRVPGGRVPASALVALCAVAEEYGDARVRVTGRANVQLRGLPLVTGALPEAVVAAIEATGLLPSRTHDLARNVLVSPLTGLVGGLADLRPVTAALDARLLAEPALAALPGRFLFTLDDGRGDLADRHRDLGLVALDRRTARLRTGAAWGAVVPLDHAPAALIELALLFLDRRGSGPTAAWHVDELEGGLDTPPANEGLVVGRVAASALREPRIETPLPYGPVAERPDLTHVEVGDAGIDAATAAAWAARTDEVVITPWHGVLL